VCSSRNLAALEDSLPTVSGAGWITGPIPFLVEKVRPNLSSIVLENDKV